MLRALGIFFLAMAGVVVLAIGAAWKDVTVAIFGAGLIVLGTVVNDLTRRREEKR